MMAKKKKENVMFVGIDPGINPSVAVMYRGRIKFFQVKSLKPEEAALAIWEGKRGECPKWYIDKERIDDVTFRVYDRLWNLANKTGAELAIGVEAVSYGSKFRVVTMAQIEYALLNAIMAATAPERIFRLAPTTCKKIVGGSGRASKEEVADALRKRFPKMPKTKDLNFTDALAVLVVAKERWEENVS